MSPWRFISAVLVVATAVDGIIDKDPHEEVASGRQQYELIRKDAKMPKYGRCWKRSLDALDRGCREMTDETQTRMALNFANCFLSMSGQKTYPCDDTVPVAECLEAADGKAFGAYSNFFTHTHNMCQFLQGQAWHEKAEETISRLTEDSARVASSLSNWSRLQDAILENQVAMQEYQRQIAADGSALSSALELSRENARLMMEEFRSSTDEQRALIFSVFDRVSSLQSLVVSEVGWIYTVVFCFGSLVLVYVATATRRTAEARLPLLLLFTFNAAVERAICRMSDFDVPDLISDRIWIARKLSALLGLFTLAYQVVCFKDYNVINNELLRDIQRQNMELKNVLKLLQSTTQSSFSLPQPSVDVPDDANDDSDGSSTLSFNSAATDRTWMVTADADDAGRSDPDDDSDVEDDFFDDVLLVDGQAKTLVPMQLEEETPRSRPQTPVSTAPKRTGRVSSRSSAPTQPRYNLRSRSFLRLGAGDNPMLQEESPGAFGRAVKDMYSISKSNAALVREAVWTRSRRA